jgi:hypothetical protein
MRRLPGSAVRRLSEGDQTPEALYELFRDWQRTQTQSSVRTLRSLRQQMDVRSCGMQGPPAVRQLLRVRKTLIDKEAETCNDRREGSGPVLHLRLRSDSGETHRAAVLVFSCENQTCSARSPSAPKEISCLPLDNDLHGGRPIDFSKPGYAHRYLFPAATSWVAYRTVSELAWRGLYCCVPVRRHLPCFQLPQSAHRRRRCWS